MGDGSLASVDGPTEIIQEMIKLQQYTFVCAPSFTQKAGLKAMDVDMKEFIAEYKGKRDFVYDALKKNFNLEKPGGAFYIFPEAPGGSGIEFVEKAIKMGVLIIPGNVFSEADTHFRISFAAGKDTLKRGMDILNRLAKNG